MAKVITFSRNFPSYHPRKGEPTYFIEKIWEALKNTSSNYTDELQKEYANFVKNHRSPKYHTIRSGNRWKIGDKFSPRVWSGKPYQSKQIIIAPDIEIKKIWNFEVLKDGYVISNPKKRIKELFSKPKKITLELLTEIAKNDGLSATDLKLWFQKPCKCQIICWNENIQY